MSKYDLELILDEGSSFPKILEKIKKNSLILEFGPASGRFTKYLQEQLKCRVHIVEINKPDFEKAMQYAEAGICSDIETMEWTEYFKNNKYDHIIFMDVLEHLKEPQKVFNACADLIKEDGSVLFSIPNAAHGDILANIYNNDFKYTEIGLLDNTHIHLFGYKNIIEMIEQSQLKLVTLDAAYQPLTNTEQKPEYYNDMVFNILNEKEYSTVYQFIGECKKISSKKTHNNINEEHEYKFAKVYYSKDMNFSEEHSCVIDVVKTDLYVCIINIPKDAAFIRFDPVEDKYIKLIIKNIKGYDGKIIHNGMNVDDGIVFINTDPAVHFDVKTCTSTEIVIEYDMEIFQYRNICSMIDIYNSAVVNTIDVLNSEINILNSNMKVLNEEMIKMNKSFNREKDILNNALQLKNDELNSSNKEKTMLNNLLIEKNQALQLCNEKIVQMNDDFNSKLHEKNLLCTQLNDMLVQKNHEYNQLQQENNEKIMYLESCINNNMTEIEELKKLIETIYNSRSWRFTKPMRMMMDKFKIFERYRGGGMLTNRLLVYSINEVSSKIDEYIIYILEHLCIYCDEIIITYTGELEESNRELLKKYSENIIMIDQNDGYVKGYITALSYYGLYNICKFDNILLVNSNIAGPINSFDELFFIMDRENVDFWGIVKNYHKNIVNDIQQIDEYIDTDFVNITKNMFNTEVFRKFIIDLSSNYNILNNNDRFRHYFTQYFEAAGFKYSVFLNNEKIKDYVPNPLLYAPVKLIIDYNCPVISLDVFKTEYGKYLDYNNGEAAYELIRYIKEKTSYNIDMVTEHIIRINNQYDIKNIMQLNYVLPSAYTNNSFQNNVKPKTALMLHMYFEDLFEETLDYAKNMPDYADIYISTQTEEKKAKIENLVKDFQNKVKVMVIKNRGRDVSALTVAFREYIYNYDIVCFAHDKKASHLDYGIKGAGYEYVCYENTLLSKAYIENVIDLFIEDKKIGILAPPVPQFSNFYLTLSAYNNGWGDNYDICCDLAKKLNLQVDIDINKTPVAPFGSIFWFRVDALKPLFDLQLDYDDFPEEPLGIDGTISHGIERIHPFIAQSRGYYCGHIYSDKFAKIHLTNLQYMLTAVNKKVFTLTPPDLFNNSLQHLSEFKNIYDNTCNNYNEISHQLTTILDNNNEILHLRSEVERLNCELGCVYNSKSWNITKPLRFILKKIKNLYFKIKNIGNKPAITEKNLNTEIVDEIQLTETTATNDYFKDEVYSTINNSELFNKEWYKKEYNLDDTSDPVLHYITTGADLGYKASEKFDTAKYVEVNYDIKGIINPLYHWLKYGIEEHRVDITVEAEEIYPNGYKDKKGAQKILLVTHSLNHTGAPVVLLQTAVNLKKSGYNVYLLSPINDELKDDFINNDIPVWINPYINVKEAGIELNKKFDFCLVNTIECFYAYKKISKIIPTILWVHENVNDDYFTKQDKVKQDIFDAGSDIYAVSELTRYYLKPYNPATQLLKYNMKDEVKNCNFKLHNPLRICVIGTICYRKGQDIFINAVNMLEEDIQNKCEFIIVGDTSAEKYFASKVLEKIKDNKYITFQNVIRDRETYLNFIDSLDILCCSSRTDPFPLVISECMMHGKACLISSNVGQAKIYNHEKDIIVFENENVFDLKNKLEALILNQEKLLQLQMRSREIFCDEFGDDKQFKELLKIIEEKSKNE